MITVNHKGNFNNSERFFKKALTSDYLRTLEEYGKEGVMTLSKATPVDTGKTAKSWNYEIRHNRKSISIVWSNSNIINGVPIAIILQYGHVTMNGGYVEGRDYINPALKPIFEKITKNVWGEVVKL